MLRKLAQAACALLVLFGAASAHADPAASRRVALVVGNGAYQNVGPLANPDADAQLIAQTLTQAGFTLVGDGPQLDLDKAQFDHAVQLFGRLLAGADVALFYYSGHGMQVSGENWLVPVDANPTRIQDLDFQMESASVVLRQMEGAGTKLNLVILDACRNNPFASRGIRAMGGGLAEMAVPEGTLISYATQPGNVAADGVGGHSPYTAALASSMREPGRDVFQVFNQVGLAVKQSTAGSQQPWVASSPISGSFTFFAGTAGAPLDADAALWQSIAGSADVEDDRYYLRRFPNGRFANLARQRIAASGPPRSVTDPAAWTDEERRLARLALRITGFGTAAVTADKLTDADLTAIQKFQAAVAAHPLPGSLGEPLASLPRLATRLTQLLVRGDASPSGVKATSVSDAEARFARGLAAEPRQGVEAAYWYAMAARLGNRPAFTQLGLLTARGGAGGPPDPASAALLWWIAAIRGEPTAAFDLGALLDHGIGTQPNRPAATHWYELAAAQGNQPAKQALLNLQ